MSADPTLGSRWPSPATRPFGSIMVKHLLPDTGFVISPPGASKHRGNRLAMDAEGTDELLLALPGTIRLIGAPA